MSMLSGHGDQDQKKKNNPEERRQGRINWTRPHRPPPRVSIGGHASLSGIPSTPWRHQLYASIKLKEGQQMAKYLRRRHHDHHQSRRSSSRPINQVHQDGHQRVLPPSRRGHGSPHGTGGPRNCLPGGEVAERHNATLPLQNGKELYQRPLSKDFQVWRLRAHAAGSRRKLATSGTQGPSRPLLQGVSSGLVQDQCGLGDTNTAF